MRLSALLVAPSVPYHLHPMRLAILAFSTPPMLETQEPIIDSPRCRVIDPRSPGRECHPTGGHDHHQEPDSRDQPGTRERYEHDDCAQHEHGGSDAHLPAVGAPSDSLRDHRCKLGILFIELALDFIEDLLLVLVQWHVVPESTNRFLRTVYPMPELRYGASQAVDSSLLSVQSQGIEQPRTVNSMNCHLYLVRHGEVSNPNHIVYGDLPGFHLSPTGVQQVHRTASHLAGAPLDLILSSPLERAIETATAIARRHALEPQIDNRLTESGQFPHWTGHSWDSIPELFPGELERYVADASSVGSDEQLSDVARRYGSAVRNAVAMGYTGIVMVGHQDPVQATRLSLTGRPFGELRIDPPRHGEVVTLVRSPGGAWTEESCWSPEAPAG